ncbi:nucleotide-diphospho-sugar transferase [Cytidiella melzeri]|nr:nucleotide-diphospho-sugar transferase [Cytidiella melzeri]
MIVLYFPEKVSSVALCMATISGFEPVAVSRIAPPGHGKGIHTHFLDQFTKLSLWSLDKLDITSLVYLDADTLVLHNFDELFQLPYAFAAGPDVWGDQRGLTLEFNAGVLFLRPNTAVYEHMLAVLSTARFPLYFAEQAFLNQYFAGSTLTLPPIYNGNLAMKLRYPELWAGMQSELRVVHYTMVKPFVTPQFGGMEVDKVADRVSEAEGNDGGRYREEVVMWGNMWEEMYPRVKIVS